MKRLPPNKFVTRVVNGEPVYLYADPLVCRCVYFGSQQNWAAYRREVLARQLANEAQMTAILNQEAWDWGPRASPDRSEKPSGARRASRLRRGDFTIA